MKDEVGAPGIVAAVTVDGKLVWSKGIVTNQSVTGSYLAENVEGVVSFWGVRVQSAITDAPCVKAALGDYK